MANWRNWAGNYTYKAAALHRPTSVEEVQELVHQSRYVKALGSRHSFHDIADTKGALISLERMNRVVSLDRQQMSVSVEGGIRYGDLCRYLNQEGYALHNLASLPHISVAGACATGTHGSGDLNRSLAAAVRGIEFVGADGALHALDRDGTPGELHEGFPGAVVSLGGLGIVTRLTLEVVPAFSVSQVIFENLPFSQVERHFDQILGSAYSVSLFTDWRAPVFNQVWLKHRILETESHFSEVGSEFFGATRAIGRMHPVPDHSSESCTKQMGTPGPWHERLPHFRLNFTPSSGDELQSEYIVPRRNACAALRAISRLGEKVAPHLLVSEVRTIAADDLWLSPCYNQASVAFHFTWKKDWAAVAAVLPQLETELIPLGVRPHWGKLFTLSPEYVQSTYPKMGDFERLLRRYDPYGKFRNAYLEKYVAA